MTAFASREGAHEDAHGKRRWTIDMRSVNGRGLDVKLRLPSALETAEPAIRKAIDARLARGTVSVTLKMESEAGAKRYGVDHDALDALAADLLRASRRTGLAAPTMGDLLRAPGVLEPAAVAIDEAAVAAMRAGIDEALDALIDARRAEGAQLAAVLSDHIGAMRGLTEEAARLAALRPAARAARLGQAVAGLDVALDEARLAQEIALIAVKADIGEELDRLRAHLETAEALLAEGGPAGRRLDFLAQELNRETNTLCAKSGDAALTTIGMELKVLIDRFREQAMNVE